MLSHDCLLLPEALAFFKKGFPDGILLRPLAGHIVHIEAHPFGIIGIIFFIPLTAVVIELVKEDTFRRLRAKEPLQ